jgi:DNA recombination protein RmuC
MRHDPELATRAWKKGIAIVTSTTLFTSLKTVASIWRLEHQNRNAQEIAEEAAKLYDKFVGFHDDFEKVGRILEQGSAQYNEARRKLRDGPGNVFRKIEQLRELGAAPSKRIRPELLEE